MRQTAAALKLVPGLSASQPDVYRALQGMLALDTRILCEDASRLGGLDLITCRKGEEEIAVRVTPAETREDLWIFHELLKKCLSAAHVEDFDFLERNAAGLYVGGRHIRYMPFLARAESGASVAAYAGFLAELPRGRSVFMGCYAVTREEWRGFGIMQLLFMKALYQAALQSSQEGLTLVAVGGDSTDASRSTWEALGRMNVYIFNEVERLYVRIPYVEPSLFFDSVTGLPTGGGAQALNLMVRPFGVEVTAELLLDMVRASYDFSREARGRDDFATWEAYKTYLRHFEDLLANFQAGLKNFQAGLKRPESLVRLSTRRRAELEAKGFRFQG